MSYVLNKNEDEEFQRLERQSSFGPYDFESELHGIALPERGSILDAGTGSGIVARALAARLPTAQITGCDLSELRIAAAKRASRGIPNLQFEKQDLTALDLSSENFDFVLCRYVLEHLNSASQKNALTGFHRVLKKGGTLLAVDVDGLLINLHPMPKSVAAVVKDLRDRGPVDLCVGRKMPRLLIQAGFESVSWKSVCMGFSTPEEKREEAWLLEQRFQGARAFLAAFLGGEERAHRFVQDYLKAVLEPQSTLFYNKFIVQGTKPARLGKLRSV